MWGRTQSLGTAFWATWGLGCFGHSYLGTALGPAVRVPVSQGSLQSGAGGTGWQHRAWGPAVGLSTWGPVCHTAGWLGTGGHTPSVPLPVPPAYGERWCQAELSPRGPSFPRAEDPQNQPPVVAGGRTCPQTHHAGICPPPGHPAAPPCLPAAATVEVIWCQRSGFASSCHRGLSSGIVRGKQPHAWSPHAVPAPRAARTHASHGMGQPRCSGGEGTGASPQG